MILRIIGESDGPLPVAEIHKRGSELLPSLGIATVYRNIKRLLDAERIRVVQLPEGPPRYETPDRGHHFHFQCEKCVKVFCVPSCPLDGVKGEMLPEGFTAQEHILTVFGRCPVCSSHRSPA
jgi:Fur family ferric uptake transcriptional regulator